VDKDKGLCRADPVYTAAGRAARVSFNLCRPESTAVPRPADQSQTHILVTRTRTKTISLAALRERKPPPTLSVFFRCVRQLAAPYSAFPYPAVVKNPSVLSRIQMVIRITTKILPRLSRAESNRPWKFQSNPPATFCVTLLTNQQKDR